MVFRKSLVLTLHTSERGNGDEPRTEKWRQVLGWILATHSYFIPPGPAVLRVCPPDTFGEICEVKTIFIIIPRYDLPSHSFLHECRLNLHDTDCRSRSESPAASVKPDTKEICKNTSVPNIFVLENIFTFHKNMLFMLP